MANALTGRIWFVDTVDADVIADNGMKVKTIRWTGAGAADAALIRDPVTNTTLWESVGGGANNVEAELMETWWPNGFEVPTLAAGNLYITMM